MLSRFSTDIPRSRAIGPRPSSDTQLRCRCTIIMASSPPTCGPADAPPLPRSPGLRRPRGLFDQQRLSRESTDVVSRLAAQLRRMTRRRAGTPAAELEREGCHERYPAISLIPAWPSRGLLMKTTARQPLRFRKEGPGVRRRIRTKRRPIRFPRMLSTPLRSPSDGPRLPRFSYSSV